MKKAPLLPGLRSAGRMWRASKPLWARRRRWSRWCAAMAPASGRRRLWIELNGHCHTGRLFSAVVPAWREAPTIGATVASLSRIPWIDEEVAVDDGSDDDTAREALRAGARVVRLGRRRGKGSALQAGIEAAASPYVLLCDADLGPSAGGLFPLCEAVRAGEADLVIGWLPDGRGAGLGLVRRLAAAGVRRLGGRALSAPLSGQRAAPRSWATALVAGPPCGFGVEVRMDVRALRWGLRVLEVPIRVGHRRTGWSREGVLHRAQQFLDVARTLGDLRLESPDEGPRK